MESTTNSFFEQVALWSQVAGAVAFLVVLVLLFRKYLVPAVIANQKARNAEIAEAEARRTRMLAEAAKARADIEDADRDAAEIARRCEVLATREHEHILAEAKAEGERLLHHAEGELERARYAARDRLRVELIEKALAKAREEAPARVTGDLNEKLVETTVADVVRGQA
jgi:F0F1-type ATP synthase membrane subunit b/b'